MKLLKSCVMNLLLISLLASSALAQQAVDVAKVVSRAVERTVKLPGEFSPYLSVAIHAKVTAFVDKVEVDRGSVVREGQLLALLVAPELTSQRAEAEAKVQALVSQRAEAEAKLVAAQSTYERLKMASETPGAIAGNELILAEKAVDAARSFVQAQENSIKAAQQAVASLKELEGYLRVTAPFSGIVTERDVHPGALVGPGAGSSIPLFRLEQNTHLRLVVAVPESEVGGIVRGARVSFRVPAYPGETFTGGVARIPDSMDSKTRTMPVEMDVANPQSRLAPGMYPEVLWPVRNKRPALLVPPSSVVTTMERTFVIRVKEGKAEWVNVTRGAPVDNLVQVYGPLNSGDEILRRGSDEIHEGTPLKPALPVS
jgi:membrane fusion protein, multidrug efflux system